MVANSEITRKGLSERESVVLSRLSAEGRRIVGVGDIQGVLDTSYEDAKVVASRLEGKGWLERLERGKYLIVPLVAGERPVYTEHEFLIASQLVEPYYIGYLSALNFHGLTEQTPLMVFIATTRRARDRTIHGIPYRFVTLTGEKFFGFEGYAVEDKMVNVSNPEKTIVDCLDRLEYAGGVEEVVGGLCERREVDLERLVEYAIRIGNGAVVKRLHYLLCLLDYDIPVELEDRLRDNYSKAYSLLDPTRPDKGSYRSRWMLRLNVREDDLLGDTY